jgi:hypothetical protein
MGSCYRLHAGQLRADRANINELEVARRMRKIQTVRYMIEAWQLQTSKEKRGSARLQIRGGGYLFSSGGLKYLRNEKMPACFVLRSCLRPRPRLSFSLL